MLRIARVSSVIAVSTALVCSVALPATAVDDPADNADTTTLTVTVLEGGLSISAPDNATFGEVKPGIAATATASAITVEVADTRAGLANTWEATVKSSRFNGAKRNADNSITNSFGPEAVLYTPLAVSTEGTLLPAIAVPDAGFQLSTDAQVAVTATNITGNHTARWSPLLALTVPDDAPGDVYTATLTHSVS